MGFNIVVGIREEHTLVRLAEKRNTHTLFTKIVFKFNNLVRLFN